MNMRTTEASNSAELIFGVKHAVKRQFLREIALELGYGGPRDNEELLYCIAEKICNQKYKRHIKFLGLLKKEETPSSREKALRQKLKACYEVHKLRHGKKKIAVPAALSAVGRERGISSTTLEDYYNGKKGKWNSVYRHHWETIKRWTEEEAARSNGFESLDSFMNFMYMENKNTLCDKS